MTGRQPKGVSWSVTEGQRGIALRGDETIQKWKEGSPRDCGTKQLAIWVLGRGPNDTHRGGQDRYTRAKEGGPNDACHGDRGHRAG